MERYYCLCTAPQEEKKHLGIPRTVIRGPLLHCQANVLIIPLFSVDLVASMLGAPNPTYTVVWGDEHDCSSKL
jgi:hypothetical protein